jgi:hypothetical protein
MAATGVEEPSFLEVLPVGIITAGLAATDGEGLRLRSGLGDGEGEGLGDGELQREQVLVNTLQRP